MKNVLLSALTAALVCTCFYVIGRSEASRNSSGTMSAANGPYISGTTINTAQVNNRFADIEAEITDSLSRSGKGGMTAALKGTDGTAAAPALSFTNEPGSGLYRAAASDLGLAISGARVTQWTANGIRVANGALATPSLSFLNDTGSGLYRSASNDIRLAINGADVLIPNAAGTTSTVLAKLFEPSLANAASAQIYLGKSAGTNTTGILTYTPNATAALSSLCLDVFGTGPGTFCVNGNALTTATGGATVSGGAGLQIGSSGTAISASYRGTASWTPGTVTAGTCTTSTITVTGSATGNEVACGIPGITGLLAFTCYISSANTCTIQLCNPGGSNQTGSSGTYSCRAFAP